MGQIINEMTVVFFFLLIFPVPISAQTIDSERAFALYYSGDYQTCIEEIIELKDNTPSLIHVEDIEGILYCGILSCQELNKQLQLQLDIMDEEQYRNILHHMEDLWDIEIELMNLLDSICDVYLEFDDDFKTQNKYLTLKLGIYSILATETDEKSYQKEVKTLQKKYVKEIFPKLQSSNLLPSEIMSGYTVALTLLIREGEYKKLRDYLFNMIEPWFCEQVILNNNFEKHEKLHALSIYYEIVNMMNIGLEAEYSPSDEYVSDLTGLNIRAKNFSYYLNGNKMYETHLKDSWQEIQKYLKEGEIAIEFCNAKSSDEHLFALIIDNKCKYPRLEYCGHSYWAGNDIFGFGHLLQRSGISNCHDIYYSTTEEMAFIDMGYNNITHKLHSISELLMPATKFATNPEVYTFADINYTLGDDYIDNYQAMAKGALTTSKLKGAKDELDYLRSTIPTPKLHVFDLDNATKEAFLNLSNLTIDILHISSHGYFDKDGSRDESITDLKSSLEGVTILNNCGIKLAGYNDDSDRGSISATEISQMDLSQVGLVILSACETGTGDTRLGNIYSLAEAFHTAGIRNIIATTTEVEDNDAYMFFKTFMTEIGLGHSYHDAFTAAQRSSKSPDNYIFWE